MKRYYRSGFSEIPENLPLLLDVDTCASFLGTTGKFIRDHCASGDIKAVKVGRCWRIKRDEFMKKYGFVQ